MSVSKRNVLIGDTRKTFSPRQVAAAIGVSESSIKRWSDQGLLPVHRTAGGHRRVALSAIVKLLRENGHEIKHPELLGLPSRGDTTAHLGELSQRLLAALRDSDQASVSHFLLRAYTRGESLARLFDEVIAPAFHELGALWADSQLEIFREHRAVEITHRTLHEVADLIPASDDSAPKAIVASLTGDPYSLPLGMIECVLADQGWNVASLGPNHPVDTLIAAIDDCEADVLLLSLSACEDRIAMVQEYLRLYEYARTRRVAVVIGGRLLDEPLRNQLRHTSCCNNMQQLVDFANGFGGRTQLEKPQGTNQR